MQIVAFAAAEEGLSKCTTFSPRKAFDTLQRITAFADLARAFKTLKKPLPRMRIPISINKRMDVDKLDDQIMTILGRLFPVDEDIMLANQMEGESMFEDMSNCVIVTAFVGFTTTWDELEEAFSDGPMYSEAMSVPLFAGAILNGFDEEQWNVLDKYFGWGVKFPKDEGFIVNLKKLYERIDKDPAIKFDSSFIAAALQDTGLSFFDFDPYEEDAYVGDYFHWSYKNIMKLAGEWQQAKKIIDRLPYNYRVGENPKQLELLMQAMKECRSGRRY